jgi:glucosamine--fructose-6-phosphate aminotransferase (isomerizing)
VVHLIEQFLTTEPTLEDAVREAMKRVEGTYGLVVLSKREPDKLIAVRKGSPNIIGIADNEHFVASDVSAIVIHTHRVIYLQDNELCVVSQDGFRITTLAKASVKPQISVIDWDISAIEKGNFKHFMLQRNLRATHHHRKCLPGRINDQMGTARLGWIEPASQGTEKSKADPICACGTSFHAAMIGKYIIEELSRVPVVVEYASEYRYRNPIIPDDTLVFVISQSGETADTLAALREAKPKEPPFWGSPMWLAAPLPENPMEVLYSRRQ